MPPQSWKLHSRGYRLALTLLGLGVVRSRELMLRRRFCLIGEQGDRKSTRLNSSHLVISYAVFCLKKKNSVHLHNYANGGARHELAYAAGAGHRTCGRATWRDVSPQLSHGLGTQDSRIQPAAVNRFP